MTETHIVWATLTGLPILAACITLAIPSIRQDIKQDYKRWRTPLEQRYATEIAAGDVAVVRPNYRKTIQQIAMHLAAISIYITTSWYLTHLVVEQLQQCVWNDIQLMWAFLTPFFLTMVTGIGIALFTWCNAKKSWQEGEFYPPLSARPWFRSQLRFRQAQSNRKQAINDRYRVELIIYMIIMWLPLMIIRDMAWPWPEPMNVRSLQDRYVEQCMLVTSPDQDKSRP
ncbi:MAG: hypothetical protein VXW65_14415 [Pseudomonadota bacterium]|nr:hypothetical protein [Pseudomonadota bacterium]